MMERRRLTEVERSRLEHAERTISDGLGTFYAVGRALLLIRDGGLYLETADTFEQYCFERWAISRTRGYELMNAAGVVDNLSAIGVHPPQSERQARPLAKLDAPKQAAVWQEAVETAPAGVVTAAHVESVVARHRTAAADVEPHEPGVYTLAEWAALNERQQHILLGTTQSTTSKTFNSQASDSIEWARWSWNPITGCKHTCVYCYARDIANRRYTHGFEPAIIPERLAIPRSMKVPPAAAQDSSYRNVFTGSMADVFGRWVPQPWIDAVFEAVNQAPQWNFLMLTKFPKRMAEQEWPENVWAGTSVDSQARVTAAEDAFENVTAGVKWLSCEPLLEPLTFTRLHLFDWVVIGGQSSNSQVPAFDPPWPWIESLVSQARDAGCKVYFKTNLHARPREFPRSEP